MMRRMFRCCGTCLLLLSACTGVSADPSAANATRIPARELSESESAHVAELVADSMRAVVLRHFDAAETTAGEVLAIDPRNGRAHAVLGLCRQQHALLVDPPDLFASNGGETELVLARQLAPRDTFVAWANALFLAESGHLSAAADAAEQALAIAERAPAAERADILRLAGTYRYELGEERAALPHLQAYVALRPDDAAAHYRLGSSLLRVAAVPRAVPQALEPNERLAAQRSAESAAKAFARSAELAPGDEAAALAEAAAWWRAAELAGERRDDDAKRTDTETARARLRTLAERFPNSAEPWFQLGLIAEACKQDDEARAAYGAGLARVPHHPATLLNLGALLDRRGERDGATTLLRTALQVDAIEPFLTARERKRVRDRVGS